MREYNVHFSIGLSQINDFFPHFARLSSLVWYLLHKTAQLVNRFNHWKVQLRYREQISAWILIKFDQCKAIMSHLLHNPQQLAGEHKAHAMTKSQFNFTEHGGWYWFNWTTAEHGGDLWGQKPRRGVIVLFLFGFSNRCDLWITV